MEILEVIIGIVFIFLVLSLVASVIQELIATFISMRGKMVIDGLVSLLEIDTSDRKVRKEAKKAIQATSSFKKLVGKYFFRLIKVKPSYLSPKQVNAILKEVMQEQTYQGGVQAYKKTAKANASNSLASQLGENPGNDSGSVENNVEPSSYNTGSHSAADIVFKKVKKEEPFHIQNLKDSIGERKLSESLEILCVDKDSSAVLDEAAKNVQENFDQLMDRVSGWYKQRVQFILLLIGFVMSFSFNADAIRIYQNLTQNNGQRQEMMAIAADFVKNDQYTALTSRFRTKADSSENVPELAHEEVRQLLDSLILVGISNPQTPLGLGWDESAHDICEGQENLFYCKLSWYVRKFFGLLITSLAISLGAPFWFDLLKKFVNVRFTGSQFKGSDQAKASPPPAAD